MWRRGSRGVDGRGGREERARDQRDAREAREGPREPHRRRAAGRTLCVGRPEKTPPAVFVWSRESWSRAASCAAPRALVRGDEANPSQTAPRPARDGGEGPDGRGVRDPVRPQVPEGERARAAAPPLPARAAPRPANLARGTTNFSLPSSSPRPTPLPAPRAPSSPQGDFARAARTNDDDDDANRAAAADTLVDLLRKCSDDPVLLKVPLRVLRDEILRRYDEHRRRRERDRASSSSSSEDEPSLPRDVESLFALFDGVHRTCVTLASRLTAGPYETIDRALRLRLFLCVCGETWRDAPALRASALRRCHAFAREEDAHEAATTGDDDDDDDEGGHGGRRDSCVFSLAGFVVGFVVCVVVVVVVGVARIHRVARRARVRVARCRGRLQLASRDWPDLRQVPRAAHVADGGVPPGVPSTKGGRLGRLGRLGERERANRESPAGTRRQRQRLGSNDGDAAAGYVAAGPPRRRTAVRRVRRVRRDHPDRRRSQKPDRRVGNLRDAADDVNAADPDADDDADDRRALLPSSPDPLIHRREHRRERARVRRKLRFRRLVDVGVQASGGSFHARGSRDVARARRDVGAAGGVGLGVVSVWRIRFLSRDVVGKGALAIAVVSRGRVRKVGSARVGGGQVARARLARLRRARARLGAHVR